VAGLGVAADGELTVSEVLYADDRGAEPAKGGDGGLEVAGGAIARLLETEG
jgi:hypothetical protein